MKSFLTRLISAVFGVIFVLAFWHFGQIRGLKILALLGVMVGGYELVRILFHGVDSLWNRGVFYFFLLCIFTLSCLHPDHAALVFAFFSICFCLMSLLTQKKFANLEALTSFQAKSILGFFYVGLLPSFAVRILDLPQGVLWFSTLLAVVFGGDIGAYIAGVLFGRRKLMPMISPKKTVEGAIGGLLCSMLVGFFFSRLLAQPILPLLILSAATAVVAQFGDLFESQLKRVADVKDSGRIMPGHGGVLDRIDGVLFASPILLFGAILLENRLV
ncbi:MAG: phosphatidate cytidylyltransferase [Bdellovibrionaceae bacterium]|nr:phosphatidate cytidylyltransferase [Pseudobdellovibrionaceae bacterium]MBX3033736.1 phosphatidate cytidylyltransferase [Pseudobdellovibrionaceae bacterium]